MTTTLKVLKNIPRYRLGRVTVSGPFRFIIVLVDNAPNSPPYNMNRPKANNNPHKNGPRFDTKSPTSITAKTELISFSTHPKIVL